MSGIDGSLFRDFTLRDVRVGELVTAERVRVRYDLNGLFRRRVLVERVQIEGALVRIAPSTAEPEAEAPNEPAALDLPRLPLAIVIDDLSFSGSAINVAGVTVSDASLEANATLDDGVATLHLTRVIADVTAIDRTVHAQLAGDVGYGAHLDAQLQLDTNLGLALQLDAHGPRTAVLVNLAVAVADTPRVTAQASVGAIDSSTVDYAAMLRVDALDPHALAEILPEAAVSASAIVTKSTIAARLDVASRGHLGAAKWNGALSATLNTDAPHPLTLRVDAGPVAFAELAASKVALRGGADGERAWLKGTIVPAGGAPIRLDVAAPVAISASPRFDAEGPWHLNVDARAFPLAWLARFAKRPLPDGAIDLDVKANEERVHAELHGSLSGKRVVAITAETSGFPLAAVQTPDRLLAKQLAVRVTVDETDTAWLMKTLALAPLPVDGRVSADVALAGTVRRPKLALTLHVQRPSPLSLRLFAAADPTLRASATVTLAGRTLFTADGKMALTIAGLLGGAAINECSFAASVTVAPTHLARFGSYVEPLQAATGTLRGTAKVLGTLRHPNGSAELHVDRSSFAGVDLGDISVAGSFDERAQVTLTAPAFARGAIAVDATLDGPDLRAHVDVSHIDVAPFAALLPSVRRMQGLLDAHVTAKGALRSPRLDGRVALTNASADAWRLPTLSNVELDASLHHDHVALEKLRAKIGNDGTLTAVGQVDLVAFAPSRGMLDVSIRTSPLPLRGMSDVRFTGHVGATLDADDERMHVAATLKDGRIDLPVLEAPKSTRSSGPLADVRFANEAPSAASAPASAPSRPVQVDVNVEPLRIRGQDVDVTVTSKIDLSAGAVTKLGGGVDADQGRVALFNRSWDLQHAAVRFNRTSDINPGVDVTLTRQFPDAFVTIRVRGTVRAPELVLSSDPPLERAQIISLVLTGSSGGKASEAGTAIAAAALTTLLGGFTHDLTSKIGIDVVRMDQGSGGPQLEIGKYLGERLYVGYRRLLGPSGDDRNGNELRLEYRLTPRIVLESGFGDAGIGGIDLMWSYRY